MSSQDRELKELGLTEGVGDLLEEALEGPGVWLHVPNRGSTRVALLKDKPLRYESHWAGGRMRFCIGAPECDLCRLQIGKKVRYVYTVVDTKQGVSGLLEVSPATALEIDRHCKDKGFAIGMVFELRKEGGVSNGRIVASFMHAMLAERDLPPGPDAVAVFRKMRDEIASDHVPCAAVRVAAQQYVEREL